MDPKQFRQIIREEITIVVKEELEPVKKDIKELRGDVDGLKKDVKEMSENLDAARGDIETLRMDVTWIKEKQGMAHSRNKREIDEIKTHPGLPLISDTPQV